MLALHEAFLDLGLKSPFDQAWLDRFGQDDRITTKVYVGGHYGVRKAALLAHATQVDPDSSFWFGLPDDVAAGVWPYDEYILAASRVATDLPEDDLFAGVARLPTMTP